ncbi:MAG: Ig-like domain-containing protein [Verrucomicrobiota bacterium]
MMPIPKSFQTLFWLFLVAGFSLAATARAQIVLVDPLDEGIYSSDQLTFLAEPSDPANPPLAVRFKVDDVTVGAVSSIPFSIEWTTVPGPSTITAEALDSLGNITGSASADINVGTYEFPASTEVAFQERNGQVVVEAEHFHGNTAVGIYSWEKVSVSNAPYPVEPISGGRAMAASPDGQPGILEIDGAIEPRSPVLSYGIQFTTGGNYDLWMRSFSTNTTNDSVYVGLDGVMQKKVSFSDPGGSPSWKWVRRSITIPAPGFYRFNVWIRETGFLLDKFLLNLDLENEPPGQGPEESPQLLPDGATLPPPVNEDPAITLTSPTAGSVVAPGSITVVAEASDPENQVAEVEFFADGVSIGSDTSAPYEVAWIAPTGVVSFSARVTDGAGNTATSNMVEVVFLTKRSDPSVVMAFEGTNGNFSIEAESYHQRFGRVDHEWEEVVPDPLVHDLPPISGSAAMFSGPDNGGRVDEDEGAIEERSPELLYRLLFPEAGSYDLWLRVWATSTGADSLFAGFNGSQQKKFTIGVTGDETDWVWLRRSIVVPVAGVNELSL